MKRLLLHIVFLVFIMTMCSCATLFNSSRVNISIITNEPSKLILDKDTLNYYSTHKSVFVDRAQVPLTVTVFTDSLAKTLTIDSRNSFAYWLNLYPNWHLWTGFLIDSKTKKRYTYPKTLFIDLSAKDSNYRTYIPIQTTNAQHFNLLKFTPLKVTGLLHPSVEVSYERKMGPSFSTQIMGSYLLPISVWDMGADFHPDIKGFRAAIEERFYFRQSAPIGPYISLEFDYLKSKYKDISNFGERDIYTDTTYNFTNYADTFGVKKQVFSLNTKLGYQLFRKRISLDFYAGLGLRYKDVEHFDRINPSDEMEGTRHPNVYAIANQEGKSWTISIPLNFRIGWAF